MENQYKLLRKPTCPYGSKAHDLLKSKGLEFTDVLLESEEDINKAKQEHAMTTTPIIFNGDQMIGGYSDLVAFLGEKPDERGKTYRPIIAVAGTALLTTLAVGAGPSGFMGFFLVLLACLKLMDPSSFQTGFAKYDLLTQKFPIYGKVYPYLELLVGLGFLFTASPTGIIGILSAGIGFLGGASILKAVYIDKLDLSCACIGGNSNVPLGIVSFLENAAMFVMGVGCLLS